MKAKSRQSARPRASLLQFLTVLLGLYTLAVYALSYTLWSGHWVAGFLMLSLPVAMGLLAAAFVVWLFVYPARCWFPLGVLVLGWPFWQRTVAWHSAREPLTGGKPLKVLSYNLHYFDVVGYTEEGRTETAPRMVNWVAHFDADVKVFQEFYNSDEPHRPGVFRTRTRLTDAGYRHAVFTESDRKRGEGFVGLAIFSKYPLLRRASRVFAPNGNGYLVADLVRGRDTLRLINVQLYSMGIRVGQVLRQRSYEGAKTETQGVLRRLKRGFERRNGQVEEVEALIRKSPHPVILCGDLNETPYGLAYGSLRQHLRNAFEDAGRGFGFTYNRAPKFIRIDNQFYGRTQKYEVRISNFETHPVRFSDHNPISAVYVVGE